MLRKRCANAAQTLRKCCANAAQTLRKRCPNAAQTPRSTEASQRSAAQSSHITTKTAFSYEMRRIFHYGNISHRGQCYEQKALYSTTQHYTQHHSNTTATPQQHHSNTTPPPPPHNHIFTYLSQPEYSTISHLPRYSPSPCPSHALRTL
jgi:hypothetical protein